MTHQRLLGASCKAVDTEGAFLIFNKQDKQLWPGTGTTVLVSYLICYLKYFSLLLCKRLIAVKKHIV